MEFSMLFFNFYAIFSHLNVFMGSTDLIQEGDSGQNSLSHSQNSETPLRKDFLRKGAFHALCIILYLLILQFFIFC